MSGLAGERETAATTEQTQVCEPAAYSPYPATQQVLALQRAAGNAAVASLLARQSVAPQVQQSMTQEGVSELSSEDIDRRIQAILDALPTLKQGSPERQASEANLKLLEEEVDSRGYYSPVLARTGLLGAVSEILDKLNVVEHEFSALFAARWPNEYLLNKFKEWFLPESEQHLGWIKTIANAAGQQAMAAPRNDPDAAFATFGRAGARVIAATFSMQLLSVWLAYLKLAEFVLRMPGQFYSVEHMIVVLHDVRSRLDRPLAAFSSLDNEGVQAVAIALPPLLDQLVQEHGKLVSEIETAIKRGEQIMAAAALVELLTSLAAMRISAPPKMPGGRPPLISVGMMAGVSSGGVLIGTRLVVTIEWIEMIRRLIAAGVIAAPVAAAGVRAGVMMMASGASPGGTGPGGVKTAQDVISSGKKPLVPGKSDLGQYGMDKYGSFANRPSDKLAGHELLQNLWLEVKGFGKRLTTLASKENPAVGLTHSEHVAVGRQQRAMGLYNRAKLAGMTAKEVIEANATAMRRAGIPNDVVETLKKLALGHAASLGVP